MSKSVKDSKSNRQVVKYLKSWEEDPRLKDWISPMSDNDNAAYCKACRRPFHPQKKVLIMHANSKKHAEKMQLYKQVLDSHQPFKEIEPKVLPIKHGAENISVNIDGDPFEKERAFFQIQAPSIGSSEPEVNYISAKDIHFEHLNDSKLSVEESDVDGLIHHSKSDLHSWKNIPEFKGWLSIDEDDSIHCLACKKELKPKKVELLKHSANKSHVRKVAKLGIASESRCDDEEPSKWMDDQRLVSLNYPYPSEEMKLVDMRSDTVSVPSREMKEAMMNTELGDDLYESDPTVKQFEENICNLLGKESCILFPSGTMANLVAVMTHCWNRDSEVYAGDQSFIYKYSQSSLAKFGNIGVKPLKNETDGTFSLETLKDILKQVDDAFQTQVLVCIENTHSQLGGKALTPAWLDEIGTICSEGNILLHMDGARLMNASLAMGASPQNLVQFCHSVTLCLNKGLGAPMGSVLCGDHSFIEKAKSVRQMLGGTIHQSGMIAAAGNYALEHNLKKLHWDHSTARVLATAVRDLYSTAVRVELNDVQTNIVHFHTDNIRVNAEEFCERLITIKNNDALKEQVKLQLRPLSSSVARLVTHCGLSKYDIHLATRKLQRVIREYDNMLQVNIDSNYRVIKI